MAFLTTKDTQYPLYLKAFHQFGRLVSAVDTLIDNPEISRIHAIIEWIDDTWYIRDLSKNGVWINHKRIPANNLYRLTLADHLCFADLKNISFMVQNLNKPRDVAIHQER